MRFPLLLFFLFLLTIGAAIAWGNAALTGVEPFDDSAFSFSPFPEAKPREFYSEAATSTAQEIVFTDAATERRIEHYFIPRPLTIKELALELDAPEKNVRELEQWVEAQWEAYKQNPNPALEDIKKRLAKRFNALVATVLNFDINAPAIPRGGVLGDFISSQQLDAIRQAIIQDSLTPEFSAEEERLLAFGSIDDRPNRQSNVPLHLAGPIACVSPNTCFRQGSNFESKILGVNLSAPCCGNGDCYYPYEYGCLDICSGAAIYDYCTGLCGCE